MAKKKGDGFKNPLADFLKDPNRVILYDEDRIYREMGKDFDTVLSQMNLHLKGEKITEGEGERKRSYTKKGKEPRYFLNAFNNVSFLRYISEWLKANDDASKNDLESISMFLAMGYRDSRMYPEIDKDLREELMLKIYFKLNKKRVKQVQELVKRKEKAIEIAMLSMLQPLYTAKNVISLLERHSSKSNKAKRKLIKKLYSKKRFDEFIGYCYTNDFKGNSLLEAIVKWALKDKKKRKVYYREYARAFKKIQRYNAQVAKSKDSKKVRKIMKSLVKDDLGFKKAFKFGKKKKRKEIEELRFVQPASEGHNYPPREYSHDNKRNDWKEKRNDSKQRRNY